MAYHFQHFDSQLNALYYHDLHQFIKPLTKMSHMVLSDDKSDHENGANLGRGRYAIVREAWCSNELIIWLRLMDLLACGEKWDGCNMARQGNSRHLRVHSSCSKDGVAISGLPKNCYDPGWLNSLKDYERDLLDIKPPLDMQFSDEEQQCISCGLWASDNVQLLLFSQAGHTVHPTCEWGGPTLIREHRHQWS